MESKKETRELTSSLLYTIAKTADPDESFVSFGPELVPLDVLINVSKGGTVIFLLIVMIITNNYSLGCWVYLSLHGTYGVVWILKSLIFPDKTFRRKVTIPVALLILAVLIIYYCIGLLMILGYGEQNPEPKRIFLCFFTFIIGLFLMVCADLQKFIILSFKPGLIDFMFLAKNRNCNYFGEILIYLSFSLLVNVSFCYFILALIWITLFGSRMYLKEVSLSKKEGYKRYKEKSYLFLFKIFDNDYLNSFLYLVIIIIFLKFFN